MWLSRRCHALGFPLAKGLQVRVLSFSRQGREWRHLLPLHLLRVSGACPPTPLQQQFEVGI